MNDRVQRLVSTYSQLGIDALVITKRENLRYIAGFSGSTAACVVLKDGSGVFVTDPRYEVQAAEEVHDFDIIISLESALSEAAKWASQAQIASLGIEAASMTAASRTKLSELAPGIRIVETDQVIEKLRAIKDESELMLLRQAAKIADDALATVIRDVIKEGVTELDIAIELEYQMRKLGGDKPGFDTIVASGPRSAMAHGAPTDRKVRPGDPIVIDFGCNYRGYTSDMTRTVFIGEPSEEIRRIYEVVLEAQLNACRNLRAGMTGREADALARSVIESYGYGDRFGHGLGHGVGLEVHEFPRLSPRNDSPLELSAVVSVEPGIYLPQIGGVRIEDIVVLRPDGIENLTSSPKELICL
ncbi:MAG: Xaa-Pro peptidase family protein [Bacillota bacterium]|nr:aminopeptidase P family protein [Bacillota bacterium]